MSARPHLSVVIPAYNEAQRIEGSLKKVCAFLAAQPYSSELLVVDDGSADATAAIVDAVASRLAPGCRPRLRLLRNQHRGKGYTVRTGMLAAEGEYLLFSDTDLSTPIEQVAVFLPLLEEAYDVVIGSREALGARRYDEPWLRHFMGRVFNWVVRLGTGQPYMDTQCGFKAFRRAAARHVFSSVRLYGADAPLVKGAMVTGFDVEVLYLARKFGYRVKEQPVPWYYAAASKVNPLRDSWQNFSDVVRVRLFDARGAYATSAECRATGDEYRVTGVE